MNISDLTKIYQKKSVPEIRPGDTVRVHFKITEGNKTRIQIFEGLCIAQKHGLGLDGTIKLRKISGGIGVERTFPLHSPLITKFEKVKSAKNRRSKLYFVRDLIGKKRKRTAETKETGIWEESASEKELEEIEKVKVEAALKKQAAKEAKEKELEEKFKQAAAKHQ